jgi:glycosyltransferase involved in cell wall biosynthesis
LSAWFFTPPGVRLDLPGSPNRVAQMNGVHTAFTGRVGIQQGTVTTYRAPLFDELARACRGGLGIFAGLPRSGDGIATTEDLKVARLTRAENRHLLDGPLSLCLQAGLLRWVEEWDPEVLIVEANARFINTPRAVKWMHRRGRPVLGWGLGTMSLSSGFERLRGAGRRRFLMGLDGIIAYSSRAKREYAAIGFPEEKIWVARNAATFAPKEPPPERPAEVPTPATVIFVGRLTEQKRIDNLLKACAAMPAELRPRLKIVGDGAPRAALEAMAKEVYPSAEFLGSLRGAELRPAWQSADLFVLPGLGGLAIQEAMASGLPVIVAEGDGTQEDLVRPETGWNVAANDLEALTATLREALGDKQRLRRMGAEAYRVIAEEINYEGMVASFLEALSGVTGKALVTGTGGVAEARTA